MKKIKEKLNFINSLDKLSWQTVKFGDVVKEAKNVSKDLDTEDIRYVVGLEHLSPSDIHIRKWGSSSEGKTFTRKFKKGQVLFGRRRAYQRKAALADFDGVCSGDIIVMEAIKDKLLPELLPFIVHSEGFYSWAVSTSAGSLSPRTKFKNLSEYEFKLPPMEIQKKLAELLWAVDEVENLYINQTINLKKIFKIKLKEKFVNLFGENYSVGDIIHPQSKIEIGKIEKSEYLKEGVIPVIDQSNNFIAGYTNNKKVAYNGKLPVVVFGDHTTILKYIDFIFCLGADGIKVLLPKIEINLRFFYYALRNLNIEVQGYRRHLAILAEKLITVPDIKQQEEIVADLDFIENEIEKIKKVKISIVSLRHALINSIF